MPKDNLVKIELPDVEISFPDVEINREEITPSPLNRHIEINNPDTQLLFCPEKGYWVRFGFPSNMFGEVDDRVMKETLRGTPFAFMAHELKLMDSTQPDFTPLENVPVVFMHGFNDGTTWRFSNDQPVVDYVKELNAYLVGEGLPPIELVAACNKVYVREPKTILGKLKKELGKLKDLVDPMGKKVRELITTDFNPSECAQVAGEYMMIWVNKSSRIDLNTGRISMTLGCKDEIYGFRELINSRIRIEP